MFSWDTLKICECWQLGVDLMTYADLVVVI